MDAFGRWNGCGYKLILHEPGVGRDKMVGPLYSPEEGGFAEPGVGRDKKVGPLYSPEEGGFADTLDTWT